MSEKDRQIEELQAKLEELQAQIEQLTVEKEEQKVEKDRQIKQLKLDSTLKAKGEYWDTIDKVWDFQPAAFQGQWEAASKLRANNDLYQAHEIMLILSNGKTIETVVAQNMHPAFELDDETTVSGVSRASASDSGRAGSRVGSVGSGVAGAGDGGESIGTNRTEDRDLEGKHAKNMLGNPLKVGEKFRAHTIPKDKECYQWWWPVYQLVTGNLTSDYDLDAIKKLGSMRSSKFIFAGEHNLTYDTLKNGVVCTIPLFGSLEAMAKWGFGDGYPMLMIADSPATYWALHMGNENAYEHIRIASPADLQMATDRVGEMMKAMADSLVSNWAGHYKNLVEEKAARETMMTRMHTLLTETKMIDIPMPRKQEGDEGPKLYVIDYQALYDNDDAEAGNRYIPDPLLALIKSVINLSFHTIKGKNAEKWEAEKANGADPQVLNHIRLSEGCKLLPVCPSSLASGEEELVRAVDPETSFQELIGKEIEIPVVSDEESDDADDITLEF